MSEKAEPINSIVLPIDVFSSPARTILELPSFEDFKLWLREETDEELSQLELLL